MAKKNHNPLIVLSMVMIFYEPLSGQADDAIDTLTVSQSQIEDLRQGSSLGAAELGLARPINTVTLELIKVTEGWRDKAYDDPSGYCTIGFGHLIALQRCSTINLNKSGFDGKLSEAEGEKILFQDTSSARIAVGNLVKTELTDNQFGALVSFTFNVGKGNFSRSTLLKILNSGNFDAVPNELRRWSSSAGKVLPGLVKRRQCEGNLFMDALKLDPKGKVNVDQCSSLGAAADITDVVDIVKGE